MSKSRLITLSVCMFFVISLASSAEFQIDNREGWYKGSFNGSFYNSSELAMGYNTNNSDFKALWRMDSNVSGNGGVLKDYSPNGYDAITKGVKTGGEGILSSGAVEFDGSGDYLAIEDMKYTYSGQIEKITVCSWVKSKDSQGEYGNFIASFDRSEYWRFSFEDDDSGDHIAWDTTDSNGNTHDLGTSESYADGEWHHVCGWYDAGTTPSKKIFVDGMLEASADVHGGRGLGTGATRYGFIGTGSEASSFDGDQGNNGARFNGSMDEFQIYDKALTDEGINSSYFNGVQDNFTASYSRRYSENFLLDDNQDWREGRLDSIEAWEDGIGLRRLSDIKVGTLDADSGDWRRINYSGFSSPVIVATVENTGNGNGLISEVKDVNTNSALIRACDSDGRGSCQDSSNHRIHYMAVDANSVNQVDGIEAGTFQIDGEFTSNSKTVSYNEAFSNTPIPFTTVQTVDGTPGIETRISGFDSGSFTGGICQQNSEDTCNGGHVTETVGWIAVDQENNPLKNSEIDTTGTVNDDSNWNTQSFTPLETPVGLVSGLSENGGQELQIDEVRNIQSDQMDVRYCEIESGNNCDTHTEENLGWMALEAGEYSLSSDNGFNTTGNYSSKIFDAGRSVYWKQENLDYDEPDETDFNVSYGVNSSGEWNYYDNFPQNNFSRFLRINVSLSGNGTNTPKINSIDLRYSDRENTAEWRSVTANSSIRNNTTLEASLKAIDYSGEVLGKDSISLEQGLQSYSVDLPESEDVIVDLQGNTSNISRSWSTNSFTLSTDPDSICDFVTEDNKCIMNQTREFSNAEYDISQLFISQPNAKLESPEGTTSFNISNHVRISGLWKGSFKIKSDSVRITPGASFRPIEGDIEIGR